MLSRDDLRSTVGEDGRDADGDQVDLVSMESRRSEEEVVAVVAAPAQQVEEEDSQAQQSARYAYIKNLLCFCFLKAFLTFSITPRSPRRLRLKRPHPASLNNGPRRRLKLGGRGRGRPRQNRPKRPRPPQRKSPNDNIMTETAARPEAGGIAVVEAPRYAKKKPWTSSPCFKSIIFPFLLLNIKVHAARPAPWPTEAPSPPATAQKVPVSSWLGTDTRVAQAAPHEADRRHAKAAFAKNEEGQEAAAGAAAAAGPS